MKSDAYTENVQTFLAAVHFPTLREDTTDKSKINTKNTTTMRYNHKHKIKHLIQKKPSPQH
jgi:hypothetical protein